MAVVLPLLFFALVARAWPAGELRARLLGAAVVSGVTVVAVTELLSAASRLTPGALVLGWAVAVVVAFAAGLASGARRGAAREPSTDPAEPLVLVLLLPIVGI